MGRKGYEIPKMIENELMNGPKSGNELKKIIIEKLEDKYPRYPNKTFDEGLIKLLEEEKIKIVGYDSKKDYRKSKQNFKSDPLILDSSKRITRPKIKKLLLQMNEDDESYQKIREHFKARLKDFDNIQIERWDYLKTWIFYATPKQIKNFLKTAYDVDEIENKLKNLDDKEEALFSFIRKKKGEKVTEAEKTVFELFHSSYRDLRLPALLKTLSKYPDEENVRIWFYPFLPEDFKKINTLFPNLPDSTEFDPKPQPDTPNDKRIITLDTALELFISCHYEVDFRGEWDKEQALLYARFGYPPMKTIFPDKQFEKVVDIMSTYPKEDRDILIEVLAKALSDEIGSKSVFWTFFQKVRFIDYDKRLTKVLGVISEEDKL